MILENIEQQLLQRRQGDFLYPDYDAYCVANIPEAILYLLGQRPTSRLAPLLDQGGLRPKEQQKVILFLVDGFGYRQWLRYQDRQPFLQRSTKHATLAPLTAVFPSTTSATLTTVHSGLTPQEHGLLEWLIYDERVGELIYTLPFDTLQQRGRDSLAAAGVSPKVLFDGRTIHQELQSAQIPSFTFTRNWYAHSAYSKLIHAGSTMNAFKDLPDLFQRLRATLQSVEGPAYCYVYWGGIDNAAHEFGPHSKEYLTALDEFFALLQTEFIEQLDERTRRESVLLMTADHGQVNIHPEQTIFLNEHPRVVENLRLDQTGNRIMPWGSPRDVYLAVQPGKRDEVITYLQDMLGDKALVMTTEQALADGLFGRGQLHPSFRGRIGDILILPYGEETVWYEHVPGKKFQLRGMHGGLHEEEMLVPFMIARPEQLLP